ncbi:hypothetical protein KC343_g14679 [Hortaea werneckii]|uniref:Uncharacterized protein n=1 Tax=Hortaea werneckii TaxID=91943 RepID=A0A3M7BIE6_HORWE|nr:hypothetical protein KC338_g9218 [Hortaea werneckii]KAI7139712.1 hypothetical protein KC352_g29773 [Hortaea werneckii]KAI7549248.1 hypothetical protein KC317_g14622 [Hortaea werneckii]KAI7597938.1 hypothetical protein KC346_g14461 [Hortaea werneckii]KAI7602952.1 hypothetical protein KC343_g14679 [Hortaea werneckii]
MDSLKEQIKVNAGLILNTRPFGATEHFSEIGIMTADLVATEGEKGPHRSQQTGHSFQAILTYHYGMNCSSKGIAAKSGIRPTAEAAVESLFMVTATALERYQGNVMRDIGQPTDVADGVIDTGLLRRQSNKDGSWGSIF